jgi:hypothetical protein
MAFKSLNLSRIAARHLRRKTPPRTGPGRMDAANRLARGANLAGLAAITMLIAALFAHAVTGDCVAARLAEDAIARAGELYEPFVIGWLASHAPGAVAAFAALAVRLAARADPGKRADAQRHATATWIRDEPFVSMLAAGLALAMFVYGISVLASEIRDQASWSRNAPRHAAAAASCTPALRAE